MARRTERGTSLLETVIAIGILGIASAALLGGIATGTSGSNLHRQQADDETVLISAGEAVLDNTLNRYVHCSKTMTVIPGRPDGYNPTYNPDPAQYPGFRYPNTSGTAWSGASVAITSVQYWQQTGSPLWLDSTASPAGSSCTDDGNYVNTLQLITITVTHPNGAVAMSRAFVKAPTS